MIMFSVLHVAVSHHWEMLESITCLWSEITAHSWQCNNIWGSCNNLFLNCSKKDKTLPLDLTNYRHYICHWKKSTTILKNEEQIDALTVRNCQEFYAVFYIFFKSQEEYQFIIYKADDIILIWCLGKKKKSRGLFFLNSLSNISKICWKNILKL